MQKKELCYRYKKKFDEKTLAAKRVKIYDKFIAKKDAFYLMKSNDIKDIFSEYDRVFFDGGLAKYINGSDFTLIFKTSGEPTFTTEGFCFRKKCEYTMTIPVSFFKNVKGLTNVAGQMCKDQLECLQRVIEHEICHLIVFMFCGDPLETEQHGKLFMEIVSDLFSHTDPNHYLPM